MVSKAKVKGYIWLIINVFRINIRVSLLSLFGLIIGLSLVSASLVYMESIEAEKYLEMFEDAEKVDENTIEIEINDFRKEEIISYFKLANIKKKVTEVFSEYNTQNDWIKTAFTPFLRLNGFKAFNQPSFLNSIAGIDIESDDEIMSILNNAVTGSNLPSAYNEFILYSNQTNVGGYQVGDMFNITVGGYSYELNDEIFWEVPCKITGIIKPNSIDPNTQFYENILAQQVPFISEDISYSLISTAELYLSFLAFVKAVFENSSTGRIDGFGYIEQDAWLRYTFNATLNRYNVRKHADRTSNMLKKMIAEFSDYQGHPSTMYSFLYRRLKETRSMNTTMLLLFSLLSVPSLVIAIVLTHFSFGFIQEKRNEKLVLLKMRGFNSQFVFVVLIMENIVISLIAAVVNIIFSIPLALLMDQTRGFLQFNDNFNIDKLILTMRTIWLVIGSSILVTFITDLRSIYQMARHSVTDMAESASKKVNEKNQSRIRGNLDIMLIGYGIIGINFLALLIRLLQEGQSNVIQPILKLLNPIIIIPMLTSPLAFLIGLILFINRYFSLIIKKTGNYFLKKDLKSLAVATRNLIVNEKATRNTSLVVALAVSFLMILASLPISFQGYMITNIHYENGADIVLDVNDYNNTELNMLTDSLQHAAEGIERTSLVYKLEILSELTITEERYRILGIDQNYSEVVYWKTHFDDQSINQLHNSLFSVSNTSEANIYPGIIDSRTAKRRDVNIQENYTISYSGFRRINVDVKGVANHWPRFFELWNENEGYLITQSRFITNISDTLDLDSKEIFIQREMYCKIKPGFDRIKVANITKTIYKNSTLYPVGDKGFKFVDNRYPDPDDVFQNFVWIFANFNFLAFLAVITVSTFIFTLFRRIHYKKEIGLGRALGMKFSQVFSLMFLEPALLFLYSSILGSLIGLTILVTFILIFGPLFFYGPPFLLTIDIIAILIIFISFLLIMLLAGLFNSVVAKRANISRILKEE